MKIRYLHYAPATAYEGVVPSEPDKLKELIDEQFAIDAKKVVADLISKNTDTIEYRGIYYNPTIGFIGYIRVPKNGTVENFKEYSFLLKTNEVHNESSIDMSEVVNKLNELTYSKEVLDTKLRDYVKTSELPDLTIYLTTAKAEEIYAKKTDIPTNVGGLTQEQADSRYAKTTDIPNVSTFITAQNVEQTYAKKNEIPNVSTLATKEELKTKIGETRANELITAKTVNLATKTELNAKLDVATYNRDKTNYAAKSQLGDYVRKSDLTPYTSAQNFYGNTINFSSGINFIGQNISGQIQANFAREVGQSGLVYISNASSVNGFSGDYVILNPDAATYSQGYVFFSYFIRPTDRKILVSFIKAH